MISAQFQDFGTSLLLLFSLLLPLVYICFIKPYFHIKESPFFTVRWFRVIFSTFSYVILVTSPLFIFFFNPEFSFAEFFLIFYRIVYIFMFAILIILIFLDLFWYGWQYVFYLGGLDELIEKKKINEIIKELKLGKRKK